MSAQKVWCIDTRSCAKGEFAGPGETTSQDGYREILRQKFAAGFEKESDGTVVCFGLAQAVHAMVADVSRNRTPVILLGPYSEGAAQFLRDVSHNQIDNNQFYVIPHA